LPRQEIRDESTEHHQQNEDDNNKEAERKGRVWISGANEDDKYADDKRDEPEMYKNMRDGVLVIIVKYIVFIAD